MNLPKNKTKIVCTIGPASDSPEMMKRMIRAGMNVARINFSYGDFPNHKKVIENLRTAARAMERRIAIMADLPGPKIRIGQLVKEPVELKPGDTFTFTTQDILGDARRVSVTFSRLPQAVKPGDTLFLNDGFIFPVISIYDYIIKALASYGRYIYFRNRVLNKLFSGKLFVHIF